LKDFANNSYFYINFQKNIKNSIQDIYQGSKKGKRRAAPGVGMNQSGAAVKTVPANQ